MNTIKNNNGLFIKIPFIAVLAAVLIAVPLRVYQYLKLINPTTGFFDESDFSIPVTYGVLILALIVCIVFSYINHKSMQTTTIGKGSKVFLAISLFMAIGTAVDCVGLITNITDILDNAPKHINPENTMAYLSSQGGTLIIFQALFSALSAFYFVVSGLSALNNDVKPKFRLLALSPVVWCVFRLLFRFKRTIAFVNVSDLLIELFAIVMTMVFFLAFAQIKSKIEADGIFWKLYGYGLPAAMLALVCFVPKFILILTGQSDSINELHPIQVSDLTFAVYAIYICIAATKSESKIAE